jgi:hypothetical protein
MTDKGYDAKVNRQAARERGICPVIPYRSNSKDKPAFFPKALYKTRARIEQTIGKLKRFKRVALRCEKTARNYAALVAFACGIILVKSVHTTLGPVEIQDSQEWQFLIQAPQRSLRWIALASQMANG